MSRACELRARQHFEQRARNSQVFFGCDFDVHRRARNDRYLLPQSLDKLSIVGRAFVPTASIGIDQELAAKNLWRLGLPQVFASDRFGNRVIGASSLERAMDRRGKNRG